MSADQYDIIQCASCGQRMRVPAGAHGKVYKCVKCGELVKAGRGTPPPVKTDAPASQQQQPPEKSMADHFVDMGLITREQVEEAQGKKAPGEKFFITLLRLEMITKDQLHTRLSKEPGAAAINLAHFTIDRDLTDLVPLEVVRKHWVLPMSSLGKSLTIAMVCPVDMEALQAVEEITGGMRIRSMLCHMDDFENAVRKHYRIPDSQESVQEEIVVAPSKSEDGAEEQPDLSYPGDEAVKKALAEVSRLPIPTRVMNQVDAVVGVESEGLRQVVAVVGNSPSLAANILATANSIAYGLPKSVDSIPLAITLVGEQGVSLLAANAPKLSMNQEKQWTALTRFSRHCAEIAAVLALECGKVTPNVAYCAGLLHALGSYVLGAIDPEEYAKISPDLFIEKRIHAEKQVFGMGYNEVGAVICEQWNLPEVLQEALRYSVTPDQAGDFCDIATIVFIASHLAGPESELNQDGMPKCEEALKSLGIDPAVIVSSLGNSAVGAASANQ